MKTSSLLILRAVTALVTVAFLTAPASAAPAPKKPAKPAKPAEPAAVAVPLEPLKNEFVFVGPAGVPPYLTGPRELLAGPKGLVGDAELRTTDADYATKDFTLDVRFSFEGDRRAELVCGIGENGREGNWVKDSVALRVPKPDDRNGSGGGEVVLATGVNHNDRVGKYAGEGPFLLRMEKKGPALTFWLAEEKDGKFVASFTKTVADLGKHDQVTAANSALFCSGGAVIRSWALVVDGKPLAGNPAKAPTAAEAAKLDDAPLVSLAGTAGLPPWLKGNAAALAGPDGIKGGVLRTAVTDLVDHDFAVDVLLSFKPDERKIATIGIGENARDGGWIVNSIVCRFHGPGHDGILPINLSRQHYEASIGKLGKVNPGPHMFRMEKTGNVLTMTVCANYKDKFVPTFSRSIPNLKRSGPFLSALNSMFFIECEATVHSVRMAVDGKVLGGGGAAVAAAPGTGAAGATTTTRPAGVAPAAPPVAAGALDAVPLTPLGGQAGLPAWLGADANALAGADGIAGGDLKVRVAELLKQDFAFDLLYSFADGEQSIIDAGLRAGDKKSVHVRFHGPGHGGIIPLAISGHEERSMGELGKNAPGPHLLRIEKRGSTLTFAVAANYAGGPFKPTLSRTLPDLAAAAPFLDSGSVLFVRGKGLYKSVRMLVGGKPPVPMPREAVAVAPPAANPGGNRPPSRTTPTPPSRTTPPSRNPNDPKPPSAAATAAAALPADAWGGKHLIKLSRGQFPTYFAEPVGMKYDAKGGLKLGDNGFKSVASDYMTKDFTLDVVYRFTEDGRRGLLVGIGENGREGGWLLKSVAAHVHGPGHDNIVQLKFHHVPEQDIGRPGKFDGPCMVRVQKKGNTLTIAQMNDFKGEFKPTIARTVPDLASFAPYLTPQNGWLFVSGHNVIESVRLVVEGEPIETRDVPLALPPQVVEGTAVSAALLKPGAVATPALKSGPAGATLSAAGQLAWTPTAKQVGPNRLIVQATDAATKRPLLLVGHVNVVAAEDAKAVANDLTKLPSLYERAVSDKFYLTSGLGGSMLLVDGKSLLRLAGDGVTVKETLTLPKAYERVAERPGYFVALSLSGKCLDLLDKKTLQPTRSIQMDYRQHYDIALKPDRPFTFVAVRKGGGDGPNDVILIVNEENGDVREPPGFYGRWLVMSADGTRLFAGYKDIYEAGSRLLVNPDRVHVIPEYGNIDLLIIYALDNGQMSKIAVKDSPGANGYGIAASPDGKRVSYMSYTGYPIYSGNIPAFDPTDFTKRPVSYMCKDNGAVATSLSYHPRLPVAAAASSRAGAVLFDRESGAVQADRVDFSSVPFAETTVHTVHFTADGRNVLLGCENPDGTRMLRRVKLKLTPQEQAAVGAAAAPAAPAPAPAPGVPQPPRRPPSVLP